MKRLACPHCSAMRVSIPDLPKDTAGLMRCPACGKQIAVFRNKMVAVDRALLESGTHEERKAHIIDLLSEFLDEYILDLDFSKLKWGTELIESSKDEELDDDEDAVTAPPEQISQAEVDAFTNSELSRLDDEEYFKKHFN